MSARPRSISDEEILDAARAVFIERGANATTAEIARRAGISEGTIFRRYETKCDLFVAAMGIGQAPPWIATLERLQGDGDVRESLRTIATAMLDFFDEIIPRMMLVLSSGLAPAEVLSMAERPAPVQGIEALTGYFERERDAGRIGEIDCAVVARMLAGSLHMYAFFSVAGLNERIPVGSREEWIAGLVDSLWTGIAPPTPPGGEGDS